VRTTLAASLLLLSLLAGCSGDKGGDGEGGSPTGTGTPTQGSGTDATATKPVLYLNITAGNGTHRFSSAAGGSASQPTAASGTGTASSSASGTTTTPPPANATGNATGNTTAPSGPAPLNVTFELGAARLPAGVTARWTFDLGRAAGNGTGNATGNETVPRNGTSLPATLTHTYTAVGDYNVTFILRAGDLAPQTLQATLHIGNGTGNVSASKPLPDQVHFEYGESLGCTGDIQGNTCVEWENGPPGGDIDGHWIALGELYWGLYVTSTVTQTPAGEQTVPVLGAKVGADTDCVFVDDALAVVGNANNGGSSCLGQVPDGAAWMFIYPYANPAIDMTVDFSATSPAPA
jgi:hypothetical protein